MRPVSIVVLSWNDFVMTESCVASLPSEVEKIIVDNGSRPDIASELARVAAESGAVLVRSEENLGYARGMNLGLAQATGETVIFSNNDIIVPSGMVKELASRVSAKRYSAAFPRTMTAQGVDSTACGNFLTVRRAAAHAFGISLLPALRALRLEARPENYEWLSGPFVAMRTVDIRDLGGFAEKSHFYSEDYRLCWEISTRSADISLIGDCYVTHLDDASARKRWDESGIALRQTRELVRAARDQYSDGLQQRLVGTLYAFGCTWRALLRPSKLRRAVARGAWSGAISR